MLEILPESQGNLLGLRARGSLTLEDCTQVLLPRLQAVCQEQHQVRLLFCLEEDFQGWDLAALKGGELGQFKDRLEKIAVAGGTWSARLQLQMFSAMTGVPVEYFSREELAKAWAWLRT